MSSSSNRIQGTVKWFSNTKGYGFITPSSDGKDDVFVHQTEVDCGDGYRSLTPGWVVEFEVTTDDKGKPKAVHVTAPGGGPCTGPRRRPSSSKQRASSNTTKKQSPWHVSLSQDVKNAMRRKSIRTKTGTVDVSFADNRIKLGTGGYAAMAHADGILAEGTFKAEKDGTIALQWERAIAFEKDEWKPRDTDLLITSLSLMDDAVGQVGLDETTVMLWGDNKTDPREALEANGFQMRQVVLTRAREK